MSNKRPRGKLPRSVSFPKWCTPDQIRRAAKILAEKPHIDVEKLIMKFALEHETLPATERVPA